VTNFTQAGLSLKVKGTQKVPAGPLESNRNAWLAKSTFSFNWLKFILCVIHQRYPQADAQDFSLRSK